MKIDTELPGNAEAVLTIEPEPEEIEEYVDMAYRDISRTVRVPGFRKGKVPRPLLERYISRDAVMEEALKKMLPQFYAAAITQSKIEPVADPKLEIINWQPLSFKAIVPLRPTVDLKDYKDIRVPREAVEFKEEQVDEVVERLRNQHSTWEPVDREVQYGDMTTVHLQAGSDSEALKNYRQQEYLVLEQSPVPVPGFSAELVGLKKGQAKEFEITIPAPQPKAGPAEGEQAADKEAKPAEAAAEQPAGTHYHFKVELLGVKQRILPELTDEFAKKVNPEVNDVQGLRERLAANLKYVAEAQAKMAYEEKVSDALTQRATVEFSSLLVEHDVDHYLAEQAAKFGEGENGLKQYLEQVGKTEAEIREKVRPLATQAIARSLALKRLGEEENIVVTPEDVDSEINNIIEGAAPDRKQELTRILGEEGGRRMVEQNLLLQKTKDRLVEIASAPPAEAAAEASKAEEERGKEPGNE